MALFVIHCSVENIIVMGTIGVFVFLVFGLYVTEKATDAVRRRRSKKENVT